MAGPWRRGHGALAAAAAVAAAWLLRASGAEPHVGSDLEDPAVTAQMEDVEACIVAGGAGCVGAAGAVMEDPTLSLRQLRAVARHEETNAELSAAEPGPAAAEADGAPPKQTDPGSSDGAGKNDPPAVDDGEDAAPPGFSVVRTSRMRKPIYKRSRRTEAFKRKEVPRWIIKTVEDSEEVPADACRGSGCECTPIEGLGMLLADCEESAIARFLDERPDFEFAEEDGEVQLEPEEQVDEPHSSSDEGWHLKRIGVQNAQTTGKGVRIWVVDSGVRTTHEEFKGRAKSMFHSLLEEDGGFGPCESDSDPKCQDEYGHGTHVAGTAAGSRFGVAPEAEILSIKVFAGKTRETLRGSFSGIIMAFKAIINIKNRKPGDVVNYSITSPRIYSDPVFKAVVKRMHAVGLHFIASAGNSAEDACKYINGRAPEAFVVGASDQDDRVATFSPGRGSNWGECVDLFAPGVRIWSASNKADDEYIFMQGTSMASPQVAGAAALLLQSPKRRSATPDQVQLALQSTAAKNKLSGLKGGPNLLLRV